MGRATIASTKNFQRQREKAIQYAIGNPSIRRIADTVVARRNVNQNACQSMAINIASLEPERRVWRGRPRPRAACSDRNVRAEEGARATPDHPLRQRESVPAQQLSLLLCPDILQKLPRFLLILRS